MISLIIGPLIGTILVILGIIAYKSFNRLARSRNIVDVTWSAVMAGFDKRLELVPVLMDMLRKSDESVHAQFHEALPTARGGAMGSEVADVKVYQTNLSRVLRKLLTTLATYPTVANGEEFRLAGKKLVELETQIETARKRYNDAVKEYNVTRTKFPMSAFANSLDYRPEDYLDLEYTTQIK